MRKLFVIIINAAMYYGAYWFFNLYLSLSDAPALISFIKYVPLVAAILIAFYAVTLTISIIRAFRTPAPAPVPDTAPEPVREPSPYDFYNDVRVAGVTFKNDDGESRQTILRRIRWNDAPFEEDPVITLSLGEYDGAPAISVLADGHMVGYVPKDLAAELAPRFSRIDRVTAFDVTGGGRTEDGDRINYGALMTIRVRR